MMFKKIKHDRIYKDIARQVLEAIFRGDLRQNDKLPSEKELGEIFGVSRVTVREAIRSLEQFGIIEVLQGSQGGAYIRQVDLPSVVAQLQSVFRMSNVTLRELTEARATLEEIILKKLIPSKIKAEHIAKLEKNIAIAENHFKEGKGKKRLLTNYRFHLALSEITENSIIIVMHKLILDLLFYFFENVKPSDSMVRKTLDGHKRILQLIKDRRFAEAADLCASHGEELSERIAEKSKMQSLLGKRA